jgi:prevent-host-death family protein
VFASLPYNALASCRPFGPIRAIIGATSMRPSEMITQTTKISDVQSQLDSLVTRVSRKETRVLVEKAGTPVAALVSADDLERLDRLDRERAERFPVIDEVREAFKDVPPEEIDREADRAVAELRAINRS